MQICRRARLRAYSVLAKVKKDPAVMWRDFSLLAIYECGVTKNSKSLLIVSRDDESNFCHAWTGVFCIFVVFCFVCVLKNVCF